MQLLIEKCFEAIAFVLASTFAAIAVTLYVLAFPFIWLLARIVKHVWPDKFKA